MKTIIGTEWGATDIMNTHACLFVNKSSEHRLANLSKSDGIKTFLYRFGAKLCLYTRHLIPATAPLSGLALYATSCHIYVQSNANIRSTQISAVRYPSIHR
jgi:hypothetical protein